MAKWLPVLLATGVVAGCGGSAVSSATDASRMVRTILEEQLADNELAAGVSISDVSCVKERDHVFQCVVALLDSETQTVNVGGTLTCDGDNCIWRGGAA